MKKIIRTDFWRITVGSEEKKTFQEMLTALQKIPIDKRSSKHGAENPILLNELDRKGSFWFGDMVKVRMDYLPPRAKVTGGVKPLRLDDDEGIGEEMAFMYDPRFRLLLTQRNHYGVSAASFQIYIYEKLGLGDFVHFEPVIRADVFARLQGMREVRKFNVAFAGVTNPDALNARGKALTDIVDLLQIFGGCNAQLSVSMGNFSGSLSLRNVSDFVKRAYESVSGKGKVTKLEIAGTDSEGEKTIFDILDYRLVKQRSITIKRDRQLTYQNRVASMNLAYEEAKDEIAKLFKPEDE